MPQAIPASNPQIASVQQAAAAIVQLINSSPRSPRQDEIEAVIAEVATSGTAPDTPLLGNIRETADRLRDAFDAQAKLPPKHPDDEATQARIDDLQGALEEFEEQIPSPPQSFADLIALAEIARAGADVHVDGTMGEAEEDDVFLRPAGRLVEAVLQFPGATSMTGMSPAHAANYREWRDLIDHHMREFEDQDETGKTPAEIEAEEARMNAHLVTMDALALRAFAMPARTWGDVVLLAQVCLWCHAPGADPEAPAGSSDLKDSFSCLGEMPDLALAKLLEAIFTVAGVGQFSEVRS